MLVFLYPLEDIIVFEIITLFSKISHAGHLRLWQSQRGQLIRRNMPSFGRVYLDYSMSLLFKN